MSNLRTGCKIQLQDLEIVEDCQSSRHRLPRKVETLVHHELQDFRKTFFCKGCKTDHKEWFAVPEEVALQSVQRWRKFMKQKPYDENGLLKSEWSRLLPEHMEINGENDDSDNHEYRNARWNRWLEEGIRITKENAELAEERRRPRLSSLPYHV